MERLRAPTRDVAWVDRDNVHLTLKFLGGVEAARLDAVAAALGAAVARRAAFHLVLQGLGAYPSAGRPRVLWAGVGEGAAAMSDLAGRVDAALAPLGFPRELRPFAAHATLGRVRVSRADRGLGEALASGGVFGGQQVAHVSLMRSDLSPRGARYTELASLPLASDPAG